MYYRSVWSMKETNSSIKRFTFFGECVSLVLESLTFRRES